MEHFGSEHHVSDSANEVPTYCHTCDSQSLFLLMTPRDTFRQVRADYSIAYKNGDSTLTKCEASETGYKYYWYGREHSTMPKRYRFLLMYMREFVCVCECVFYYITWSF